MDTTTTDGGASSAQGAQAQPQSGAQASPDSAAVTEGYNVDQVVTTDDNGTPTLEPTTSAQSANDDAVSEESSEEQTETQAPATEEFDAEAYAKKKGIDLSKADPKTLVKMQYEAEKKMHEATEKAKELETASVAQVPIDYTGDSEYDSLANSVNTLIVQNKVRDFFSDNPEAREFEPKMAEIVTQRPHLQQDLDALYALARSDPSRDAELKQAGGKEALTNLAQKQQQIPPAAGATNSGVYESQTITPQNVYTLVDKNDQEWFEKNHKAISKAMSGK